MKHEDDEKPSTEMNSQIPQPPPVLYASVDGHIDCVPNIGDNTVTVVGTNTEIVLHERYIDSLPSSVMTMANETSAAALARLTNRSWFRRCMSWWLGYRTPSKAAHVVLAEYRSIVGAQQVEDDHLTFKASDSEPRLGEYELKQRARSKIYFKTLRPLSQLVSLCRIKLLYPKFSDANVITVTDFLVKEINKQWPDMRPSNIDAFLPILVKMVFVPSLAQITAEDIMALPEVLESFHKMDQPVRSHWFWGTQGRKPTRD